MWIAMASLGLGMLRIATTAIVGPIFSGSELQKLTPGMSKGQVEAVIGKPTRYYGSDTWIYERTMNPGWVAIYFDDEGQIREINDESVFRP